MRIMTLMKISRKFINRLERVVEKYATREQPLDEEPDFFMDETDEEFQEIMTNYRFYYEVSDKQKDGLYLFDYEVGDDSSSDKVINILLFDESMVEGLKKLTEFSSLYSTSPEIDLSYLHNCINDMRIKIQRPENDTEDNRLFLSFVEEIFHDSYQRIDKMIADNRVDYNSLWYYFDRCDQIYCVDFFNKKLCFKHSYFEYQKGDEQKLVLYGKILFVSDGKLKEGYYGHSIEKFTGTRSLDSFGIKKFEDLTDEERESFAENGRKTLSHRDRISYMHLKGTQYVLSKQIVTFMRDNRAVVDSAGLEKFDNKVFDFDAIKECDGDPVTTEDLATLFPFVGVFSMGSNKCWGSAHVSDLKPVEFQRDAFDYLVLDESKKTVLQGLIKHHRKDLEDFIEGKGQGLILLLNGPPGVGKTLTAEATAEHLQKPLYNVNVGDLGTNPEVMEGIMERIIDYSERWGAIILIDEADIFLEEREFSNILRNALVSTFLKFLEFNRGIMFLTTNRLNSLDEAVKSRVNMFLSYDKLDYRSKVAVWRSLLKKWKIELDESYVKRLASNELNGREIRNYMRLVVSLLDDRGLEYTGDNIVDTLEECVKLTNEFHKNVKGSFYT